MNVVYISREEYIKKWEEMKGNLRFENPCIDPVMRNMTVQGYSGEGTSFANEYERLHYEYFNPKMPSEIIFYGLDGTIVYRVKREE